MTRFLPSTCALVLFACGCGGQAERAATDGTTATRYVMKVEPATLPEALPPEACFVGIDSYDVMVLGVGLPEQYSCSRVAEEVFPGVDHLAWSRDEYLSSEGVDECELERGGGRLHVIRGDPDQEGPRFERAYDLTERACAQLEREGWKVIFQEK